MHLSVCSILAVAPVLAAGCILEPPPDLSPERTPPVLDAQRADPPTTRMLVVATGDADRTFRVPVRSNDGGEELAARLYVDYSTTNQTLAPGFERIPASTFDDLDREISMLWTVPQGLLGCHHLTMVVTHLDNIPSGAGAPPFSDPADVATITWWLNANDDPDELTTLTTCP